MAIIALLFLIADNLPYDSSIQVYLPAIMVIIMFIMNLVTYKYLYGELNESWKKMQEKKDEMTVVQCH